MWSLVGIRGADEEHDIGKLYANKMTITLLDQDENSNYDFGLNLTASLLDASVEHNIDCSQTVQGGSFSCDKKRGTFGETVAISLNADKGLFLGDIDIVGDDGLSAEAIIDVLSSNDGKTLYTVSFNMLYSNVTVIPHFANAKVATFDDDGALNNYTYFHMECDVDEKICSISQGPLTGARYHDDNLKKWTDFKYWYRGVSDPDVLICKDECTFGSERYPCNCEYGLMDVYRKLYPDYAITFADTLRFGGYDSDAGKCAMQFEPFTGEYYDKNTSSTKYGDIAIDGKMENGENAVIDGMCRSSDFLGLAYANGYQAVSVSNLTITNAYIETSNANAGVIASFANGGVGISNVKVSNANVQSAGVAGGLVGYATGDNSRVVIDNSSFDGEIEGPFAGGLVGVASLKSLFVKESFVTASVSGSRNAGGIVGAAMMVDSLDIEQTYAKAKDTDPLVAGGSAVDGAVGGIVGDIAKASGSNGVTLVIQNPRSLFMRPAPVQAVLRPAYPGC